jgi:hypothetical protein
MDKNEGIFEKNFLKRKHSYFDRIFRENFCLHESFSEIFVIFSENKNFRAKFSRNEMIVKLAHIYMIFAFSRKNLKRNFRFNLNKNPTAY